MPAYTFFIISNAVLAFNGGTGAFDLDGGYDYATDRFRIDVNDDDAVMDSGGDANQFASIYDMDDNLIASGIITVPAYAEVSLPGGGTGFLDRIEIDGVHYGYLPSFTMTPGASYPVVDSATAPTSHTYYKTNSVPCFGPDTIIDTVDGPCPIAQLQCGDLVLTYDNGAQPVLWTGARRVTLAQSMASPQVRPIILTGELRGMNTATHPLILSQQHRALIRDPLVELVTHGAEAFVHAGLLGRPTMPSVPIVWHHFLLPQHEVVRANGVWVESLFVGDALGDIVTGDQRDAIAKALGAHKHRQTARPCLRKFQVRFLLARLRAATPDTSRNKRVA